MSRRIFLKRREKKTEREEEGNMHARAFFCMMQRASWWVVLDEALLLATSQHYQTARMRKSARFVKFLSGTRHNNGMKYEVAAWYEVAALRCFMHLKEVNSLLLLLACETPPHILFFLHVCKTFA